MDAQVFGISFFWVVRFGVNWHGQTKHYERESESNNLKWMEMQQTARSTHGKIVGILWSHAFLGIPIFEPQNYNYIIPCVCVHLHKCDAQTNDTYLLYNLWKWKRAWLKLNIFKSKCFWVLIEIRKCTKRVWKFYSFARQ